ncbi:MAG: hypothetical protein AB8G86_08875 [Saprospiraceae bacterium]
MKIELVPVIEIGYNNQGLDAPEKYPYWKNQEIWYNYREMSLDKAGFEDEFKPYLKGSPFYEPKNITDKNLEKIVVDHTQELRKGEYERQHASCLFGGYVLKINGEDKYFPQCCGDLSDIIYWDRLSNKKFSYYEGHPAPDYKFDFNKVVFDFSVGEHDEHFEPTPPNTKLKIDLRELKIAVEKAKVELKKLSERIIKINQEMNLGIDRIDDLLIWENPNHE